MRTLLGIAAIAVATCALSGCDGWREETAPDTLSVVTVGFRRGLTSDYVLQVSNLSAAQGIEAKVHAVNAGGSKDSAWFVIPAAGMKDIGRIEMGWGFSVGDRGSVTVASHPTIAYFAVLPNGKCGVLYSKAKMSDEELAKVDFSAALRDVR